MTPYITAGTCESEETFFYYKIEGGSIRKYNELVDLVRAVAEDVAAEKMAERDAAVVIFVAAKILPLKNARDEYVFDDACFIAMRTIEQSPDSLSGVVINICAHLEEMIIDQREQLEARPDFSPSYNTWYPNTALRHEFVQQTTSEQQAWSNEKKAA